MESELNDIESIEFKDKLNINNINSLKDPKEVRICVIGNVDSGKSTLISVLSNFVIDDGNGSARKLVLSHLHEKNSGRTSSISLHTLGYKNSNPVIPVKGKKCEYINQNSDKLISLVDLCGHEKYLKTTTLGLTGYIPDYVILIIGANMGFQRITKEHLDIAFGLKVLIIVKLVTDNNSNYQNRFSSRGNKKTNT